MGLVAAAVGAFFLVRLDAGNDREKQLRAETTEQTVIAIRKDMKSDAGIKKLSDEALFNLAREWMRPTGPR